MIAHPWFSFYGTELSFVMGLLSRLRSRMARDTNMNMNLVEQISTEFLTRHGCHRKEWNKKGFSVIPHNGRCNHPNRLVFGLLKTQDLLCSEQVLCECDGHLPSISNLGDLTCTRRKPSNNGNALIAGDNTITTMPFYAMPAFLLESRVSKSRES